MVSAHNAPEYGVTLSYQNLPNERGNLAAMPCGPGWACVPSVKMLYEGKTIDGKPAENAPATTLFSFRGEDTSASILAEQSCQHKSGEMIELRWRCEIENGLPSDVGASKVTSCRANDHNRKAGARLAQGLSREEGVKVFESAIGENVRAQIAFKRRIKKVDYDFCDGKTAGKKEIILSGKLDNVIGGKSTTYEIGIGGKTIPVGVANFQDLVVHYCSETPEVTVSVSSPGFQGVRLQPTTVTLRTDSGVAAKRAVDLVKYPPSVAEGRYYATVIIVAEDIDPAHFPSAISKPEKKAHSTKR